MSISAAWMKWGVAGGPFAGWTHRLGPRTQSRSMINIYLKELENGSL